MRYASLALGDDAALAVAALDLELSASASMSASAAGAADAVPAAGALTFGYTDAPALFSLAPAAVLAAVPAIVTMTVAGFGDVATATALVSPGSADDAVSLNGGESFGLAALDANDDGEGADEALLKYALLPRVTLVEPPGRRTRRRDSLRQMRCVLTG